jgi:quercetin dioxygenase-like cupin family protein
MAKQKTSAEFLAHQSGKPWEQAEKGILRQILGYDASLMMVKVKFETGAVSARHTHPHTQTSYVASGRFKVEIAGEVKTLDEGDAFYVPPGVPHGATCLESGMLIDSFSPCREDFL